MIKVVILKPTKDCNADCSYCSAPPDMEKKWSIDDFKLIFDRLLPELDCNANLIWHGGEPMLMGIDFYLEAWKYATSKLPGVSFSMQTNILLYTKKWKSVFDDVFNGSISTSYDADEKDRTIKGSTEKYNSLFFKKLNLILSDGFNPLVIGTYTNNNIDLAKNLYDKSKSHPDGSFSLRFNYRYPAGRVESENSLLSPFRYGEVLIELYNKWIKDRPDFLISPLDHMFKKALNINMDQCPWTRKCGGTFISVEPNGDTYNCADFADLGNLNYRYGNILENWVPGGKKQDIVNLVTVVSPDELAKKMLNGNAARLMKRRTYDLPQDCMTCPHYKECEGGCMRDAELYNNGLGGKFYYCESWKMVFGRIKESIINGEADGVLEKFGFDVDSSKEYVRTNMEHSL